MLSLGIIAGRIQGLEKKTPKSGGNDYWNLDIRHDKKIEDETSWEHAYFNNVKVFNAGVGETLEKINLEDNNSENKSKTKLYFLVKIQPANKDYKMGNYTLFYPCHKK